MKKIKTLIIGLLLTSIFTLPAGAGSLTTNKFIYKPSLGARGDAEKKTFDAGLDRLDARLGKEIWVGDPNYGTTFQDAIAAIGTTNKTILRIPAGAWPLTSQLIIPANITLDFEPGAYLDCTGLLDAPIEAMSSANPCQITITGHGLQNGDQIKFYNILQAYVASGSPGAAHDNEWMNLNDQILTVTVTGPNTFTIPVDASAWHTYVAATDPGRACVPVVIKGQVVAGPQQIFIVSSPAQISFATDYAYGESPGNPRSQTKVYPEWFGAVGDGSTDDLLALNACYHALKYYDKAFGEIFLSHFYAVSSTWSLNDNGIADFGQLAVTGVGRNNSGIVGLVPSIGAGCDGKPVIEALGSACLRFKNFGIYGTNSPVWVKPPGAPSVGLLLGADQTTINTAGSDFNDLYFSGWFKYGTMMNRGHAQSQWDNIESNVAAWSDGATPTYAFDFFFGAGERALIWSAIQPTNAVWNTWATNRDCGGNFLTNVKLLSTGGWAGQKAPGCAVIYQDFATPNLDKVLCGDRQDYYVYARDCDVYMKDCDGDGTLNVAGISMVATGAPAARTLRMESSIFHCGSAPFILTDANTALSNAKVANSNGGSGSGIILGQQLINSRFEGFFGQLAYFTVASAVLGCHLEIPANCAYFSMLHSDTTNPAYSDANIIIRHGPFYNGGHEVEITGDLRLGTPDTPVPPNLIAGQYKMTWAGAAPTAGSWAQGSVVWNTGAAAGTSPGWICNLDCVVTTDPRCPLNGGATTGTITTGTNLLTVNAVTNLKIGDFIDVAADAGGYAVSGIRVVNLDVANKIATLATNASATATGGAVSFHNHTTAEAFSPMPGGAHTSGVTAAITTGTTVTHGLGLTPTKVLLTPADAGAGDFYASALGATTFTVNFAGAGSHAFYWEAIQ